jgi:hypothetical protein
MKRLTFRDYLRSKAGMRWLGFQFRPDTYKTTKWWQRRHWIKFWGIIPDCFYYWKCRIFKRHNTVTAPDLYPTWQDPSELLLHVSFAVLVFACEVDGWFEGRYYYSPEEIASNDDGFATPEYMLDQNATWQEVATLYDWWLTKRPARIDPVEWYTDTLKAHGMYTNLFDSDENYEVREEDGMTVIARREKLGNPDKKEYQDLILRMSAAMEQGYEDEDELMLKRLAEVRLYLWT